MSKSIASIINESRAAASAVSNTQRQNLSDVVIEGTTNGMDFGISSKTGVDYDLTNNGSSEFKLSQETLSHISTAIASNVITDVVVSSEIEKGNFY